MKRLIVNADDFGYSRGINEGIIKAHSEGIVTSTSLMVETAATGEALKLIEKYPSLGVGLHLVFAEEISRREIEKQLSRQTRMFKRLTGRMPDHIDGHLFNIHRLPRGRKYFLKFSRRNGIPIRGEGGVNFIYSFFGMQLVTGAPRPERVTSRHLLEVLKDLPEGVSELMCHPGYITPDLKSSYTKQREMELEALTDPRVKEAIRKEGIKLINWSQL